MAATPSIDLSGWFDEQLAGASPDLLRDMIKTFAEALMGADADAVCGAEYRARSAGRTNSGNGYRARGGTSARAPSRSPSPSCARAVTSRIGCSNGVAARSRPWSLWSPRPTCSGCPPGGWSGWSRLQQRGSEVVVLHRKLR